MVPRLNKNNIKLKSCLSQTEITSCTLTDVASVSSVVHSLLVYNLNQYIPRYICESSKRVSLQIEMEYSKLRRSTKIKLSFNSKIQPKHKF